MNSLFEQETYWDKVAEEKEFPVPFRIDLFQQYVLKEMNILEVGCGYGRILNELYNNGFERLMGIDISQNMINRGLRNYPFLNIQKSSGAALPFPNDTFHAVILVAVLTCIPESKDQRKLISEILRVLKGGGVLYVHDCMLNQDKKNIERYEKYIEKYGEYGIFELPEGAVVRHHSNEHIIDLMTGFDQKFFEMGVHTTMNGNKTNGFCFIGRKSRVGIIVGHGNHIGNRR